MQRESRSRKSPKAAREDRLLEIAVAYARGMDKLELAQRFNRTAAQINLDIAKLHQRWNSEAELPDATRKAVELVRLSRLEQTYWDAWERSMQPKSTQSVTKTATPRDEPNLPPGAPLPVLTTTREVTTLSARDGNPAFLQGVAWVVDRRLALFGLDAPKTVNIKHELEKLALEEARRLGLPEADALEAVYSVLDVR